MLALRARAGLRVISGGVAITQCFRFLSATNSLSFRFYGVGKGTLGIDPPSVVAVLIPHEYRPRVPGARETPLRVLPVMAAAPRFDLRSLPARAPVRHRRLAEPRLRCAVTQSPGVRRGISRVQFSDEKQPQLRLPLSELAAPCKVLLARRSEFKENAVRGGSHVVEIVVDRVAEGVTAFRGHLVVLGGRLSCKLREQSNRRKEGPVHV